MDARREINDGSGNGPRTNATTPGATARPLAGSSGGTTGAITPALNGTTPV
ncbi:MAG: hypothetical protein ACRDTH_26260 [Pseudonocardiaceae bacterium]